MTERTKSELRKEAWTKAKAWRDKQRQVRGREQGNCKGGATKPADMRRWGYNCGIR